MPGLVGAEGIVVDGPEGTLERVGEVAAVVDERVPVPVQEPDVVRHLVGPHEVSPPELGRIQPDFAGEHVQDPVHDEHGLGAAGAAVRRVGRLVGHDRTPLD